MPEPFKNFINKATAQQLGRLVSKSYPKFSCKSYLAACFPKLESLELKDRAHLLGDALWTRLPPEPKQAFELLTRAVQTLPTPSENGSGAGWLLFPLNSILARHGPEAFSAGIELAKEVTKRFTAEFGIRSFLAQKPERALRILKRWTQDPDVHVRRLVSEGTGPRLPWAEQLPAFIRDPRPILPLLETLKDDPEEYVRRSVANSLNDISKDHPGLALDVAENWLLDAPPQRVKLIKHACRSLIKAGNPRCLALLGHPPPQITIESFSLSKDALTLGDKIVFEVLLQSKCNRAQSIIADFRFHFVKANGKTAPKVFKGTLFTLGPKMQKAFSRSFHLRKVTTRKYYSGQTTVELLLNGKPYAKGAFNLIAD